MYRKFNKFEILIILIILLIRYSKCYQEFNIYDQKNGSQYLHKYKDNFLKIYKDFVPILLEKNGPNSGALVQQSWNYTNLGLSNTVFKVKLKNKINNIGIIATIQNMRLRRGIARCIDHIKFRYSNKRFSEEICGDIGPNLGQVISVEDRLELETHIFIEKSLAVPYTGTMSIFVVFTALKDCDDSSEENDNELECTLDKKENICISSIFRNDGIKNCPPPYCNDENGCIPFNPVIVNKKPSSSSIALSAITSLIFTMCGVGTCMWVCWKYRECIRLGAATENDRTTNREFNSNIQMQTSPNSRATAPQFTPTEDKDLPPSYDSLFGNTGETATSNPQVPNANTSSSNG